MSLGVMYVVASILHFYKSRFNNAVCNVCTHACVYGLYVGRYVDMGGCMYV